MLVGRVQSFVVAGLTSLPLALMEAAHPRCAPALVPAQVLLHTLGIYFLTANRRASAASLAHSDLLCLSRPGPFQKARD